MLVCSLFVFLRLVHLSLCHQEPNFVANSSGPAFASLLGLGFQFNHNLYAPAGNVSQYPGYLARVERAIDRLGPQFVRVFVAGKILNDSAAKDSFLRTLALATTGNSKIGDATRRMPGSFLYLTWWYDLSEQAIEQFADLVVSLVAPRSVVPCGSSTRSGAESAGPPSRRRLLLNIQNEPNGPGRSFTWAQYRDAYLRLHKSLIDRKVRDCVALVPGGLLLSNQSWWLHAIARELSPIADFYSFHVYWDHKQLAKLQSRPTSIAFLMASLPAEQRRPLLITEYGVRGEGKPVPGTIGNVPTADSHVAAFQEAWFVILSLRLGFVGFSKWDGYWAMYDRHEQFFSIIHPNRTGDRNETVLAPAYHLYRMLIGSVHSGLSIAFNSTHVPQGDEIAVEFYDLRRNNGQFVTRLGLLTSKSGETITSGVALSNSVNVCSLPADRIAQLSIWKDGVVASRSVRSNRLGCILFELATSAVYSITLIPPASVSRTF